MHAISTWQELGFPHHKSLLTSSLDSPKQQLPPAVQGRWMHTGDLAVIDSQGYCSIVGRIKDMVIRGGENLYRERCPRCVTPACVVCLEVCPPAPSSNCQGLPTGSPLALRAGCAVPPYYKGCISKHVRSTKPCSCRPCSVCSKRS